MSKARLHALLNHLVRQSAEYLRSNWPAAQPGAWRSHPNRCVFEKGEVQAGDPPTHIFLPIVRIGDADEIPLAVAVETAANFLRDQFKPNMNPIPYVVFDLEFYTYSLYHWTVRFYFSPPPPEPAVKRGIFVLLPHENAWRCRTGSGPGGGSFTLMNCCFTVPLRHYDR